MIRKKIAVLIPNLAGGGAEKTTVNLIKRLISDGIEVDLIIFQKTGIFLSEIQDTVNIINLNTQHAYQSLIPLLQYLFSLKSKGESVHILSVLEHANIIAIVAKLLSGSSSKVFVSIHSTLSRILKISLKGFIAIVAAKFLYALADGVICVSDGVKEDWLKQAIWKPKNITTIYNPIYSEELIEKSKEDISDEKIATIFQSNSPIILGIGRLTEVKNFDLLIKAFAKYIEKTNSSKAHLIILGEGPEREKLEKLINELQLNDRVSLPGFVSNPCAILSKANLFVLSSRFEGLPTVLVEALACACPVVSVDCESGPKEILNNGEYGILIPNNNNDEECLAEAIERGLTTEWNKQKLQDRAKIFSIENSAAEYLKFMGA